MLYLQPARQASEILELATTEQTFFSSNRAFTPSCFLQFMHNETVAMVSLVKMKEMYSLCHSLPLNDRDSSKPGDWSKPVYVYLKQIMQCQEADVWLLLSDTLDYRGNDLKHKAIAAEN